MSTSDAIAAASGISNRRTGKTFEQIFKATYSNVPVYEYVCRGVAVMRRRSDAYVNATHILKVANFNKPQRTRILETEIQTGQHEKIQGGYGKYQGTWVPLNRAAEVAKQFGVEEELRPLFDFTPTSVSPPPAPKHITAATVRPKKPSAASLKAAAAHTGSPTDPTWTGTTKPVPLAGPKILKRARVKLPAAVPAALADGAAVTPSTTSISPPTSGDKSSSRPKRGSQGSEPSIEKQVHSISPPSSGGKSAGKAKKSSAPKKMVTRKNSTKKASTNEKRKQAKVRETPIDHENSSFHEMSNMDLHYDSDDLFEFDRRETENLSNYDRSTYEAARSLSTQDHGRFASVLFTYFTSTLTQIPQILLTPPPSLDVNLVIDDDGNTPLHWATATARMKVSRHLVDTLRADVNRVNTAGQTPLMRAVQFPDNHDERTFPVLLDLLQPSLLRVDRKGHSVLHHIVISASYVRTSDVACYYMRRVLDVVVAFRNEYGKLLNLADVYGETALDIARRVGSDRLPKLLVEAGASRPHLDIDDSEGSDNSDDDMDLDMVVPVKPETGAIHPAAGTFDDEDSRRGTAHFQAKKKIVPIWRKFAEDARASFALQRQEQDDKLEEIHSLIQTVKEEANTNKRTLSEYQQATAELPSLLEQAKEREDRLTKEMLFNQSLKMRKEISVAGNSSGDFSVAQNREERVAELKSLRAKVKELEEGREELTARLAGLKGKANQAKKYQNLIAVCCNVPMSEVGSVIEEMSREIESV